METLFKPDTQPHSPVDNKQLMPNRGIEGLGRNQIVRALEVVQDFIIVALCLGLFCVMVLQLKETFVTMFTQLHFHEVTADILFLLILVEVFRLLVIYLQEHRVSIGVAVEVAIVSVLRDHCAGGLGSRVGKHCSNLRLPDGDGFIARCAGVATANL
jgi:hypothetical protein